MAKRRGSGERTVIIRREEVVARGHHGGAWKVAYADFVTAMMAFFLLMWLLNATTEQQRRGIAAYFSPLASVENGFSGAGLIPGGVSPLANGTSLVAKGTGSPPVPAIQPAPGTQAADPSPQPDQDAAENAAAAAAVSDDADSGAAAVSGAAVSGAAVSGGAAATNPSRAAGGAAAASSEQKALLTTASAMRRLLAADPAIGDSAGQMAIDVTPEGLRIQIMDRDAQPMFERGAARLNDRAIALLRKVAPFLAGLPEPVSIGGYTDASPWPPGAVTNWSLSSGRADAARAVLTAAGLPDARIIDVSGYADRQLLLPAEPLAAANRRIVLTLHRTHRPPPAAAPPAAAPRAGQG